MKRKPPIIFIALFVLAGFVSPGRFCFAAGSEPIAGEGRIEAVVIHVDEYAVYAPNLVFYFDSQMDKRKIDSLKRAAEQLRNRKALITYSSSADKRLILSTIVSADEKSYPERPGQEVAIPGEVQRKPAGGVPDEESSTRDVVLPAEPKPQTGQTAAEKVQKSRQTGQTEPITKEEINSFVRRLLYLNGRKDLAGIAPFYADKVDYYDRGILSRDKVLQDLRYYFRNWREIDTRLDGDVLMTGFEPEVRIVKFICSYSVKNDRKSIAGKTENIWTIQRIDGELRLIDVKQKDGGRRIKD